MTDHTDTTTDDSTDTTASKPDWWGDLEDGERADAIVNDSTERTYIRDDGKRYWFDLREPTWQKKSQLTDDALTIERNKRDLNTTQYYRDMLEYMVVDASIDIGNWATFMAGARSTLADKLTAKAPSPGRSVDEDEEGNSDQPSDQDENGAGTGPEDTTQPSSDTTGA